MTREEEKQKWTKLKSDKIQYWTKSDIMLGLMPKAKAIQTVKAGWAWVVNSQAIKSFE